MIITLIFCVDVKWQISQQPSLFLKLSLWHWQITPLSFWKHPVVIVETFKVKVYLTVSRHFPAQPFCSVLVLAFAWQLFSSLHLRMAPFLGRTLYSNSNIGHQNHGFFFVYYLQLLFSLLNNPLFAPPHHSGAQEPSCQPIDALPPPLLQEPCQPIEDLPWLLLHFLSR